MSKANILIIEDSEADHFLFKVLAEDSYPDLAITPAYDGQQAYELLANSDIKPDIIFLDINMPRMNGYEFLEKAEALISEKQSRVFILSSSNQDSDKDKALSYACVEDFMEKPFNITFLEQALSRVVH